MTKKFANAKPFLFDHSFDDPTAVKLTRQQKAAEEEALAAAEEAARIAAETPPPPSFSEEELAAAKATAFDAGHKAGFAASQAETESQITSHLQVITGQLAVLHDKQQLANEMHATALAQLTGEILAKLLPFYANQHGAQEITTFIKDCLSPILDDSRVVIHLSPEFKKSLENRLFQIAEESGFSGRLLIHADESLSASDVRVTWDGGGAERNWNDIWIEIDKAIHHATHSADEMALCADLVPEQPLSTKDSQNPDQEPSALEQLVASAEENLKTKTETKSDILSETAVDKAQPGAQNGG